MTTNKNMQATCHYIFMVIYLNNTHDVCVLTKYYMVRTRHNKKERCSFSCVGLGDVQFSGYIMHHIYEHIKIAIKNDYMVVYKCAYTLCGGRYVCLM